MQAIRVSHFGPDAPFPLAEVELPALGAHDVRVSVKAIGINPNDTYVQTGNYASFQPSLPYTPGFDAAGVVTAVGPAVTRVAVGARVHVSTFNHVDQQTGTYAETVQCAEESVWPLPELLTFEQGAALGIPSAIAERALEHAAVVPGEAALVHGASGAVGTYLVQLLKARDVRVIATSSQKTSRDFLTELGADVVMPHLSQASDAELAAVSGTQAPDMIFEVAAGKNLAQDLDVVRPDGRIVLIGARQNSEISPRTIFTKEVTVTGVALGNATQAELDRYERELFALIERGVLTPVVGERLPLSDAKNGQRRILETKAPGRLLLIP